MVLGAGNLKSNKNLESDIVSVLGDIYTTAEDLLVTGQTLSESESNKRQVLSRKLSNSLVVEVGWWF